MNKPITSILILVFWGLFLNLNAQTQTVKVALVLQNPEIASQGNQRIHEIFNWQDPVTLANAYETNLEIASGGVIDYEIVATYDADILFTRMQGTILTPDSLVTLLSEPNWPTLNQFNTQFDYNLMIDTYDFCSQRDAGSIQEVWVYSMPFGGLWESTLAGEGAFFYNSSPVQGTSCQDLLPIMGLNYERGDAEALHSYGHRMESTIRQVYGRWEQNPSNPNNWEKFAFYHQARPGEANVGNVHFPPNGTADYNYDNTNVVSSFADDWDDYPHLDNDPARTFNCQEWGCDQFGYMMWWLGKIPNVAGINADGHLNNWWAYAVDYNAAIAMENGGTGDIDLELNLTTTVSNPPIYSQVPLTYTVTNTSTTVATNVKVYLSICNPQENRPRLFFNEYGIVNASRPADASTGTYSVTNQTWSIPELAGGASETITIYVFTLTEEPRTILGEILSADQTDIDSSPNLLTCTTSEDDEASLVLNEETPTENEPCQLTISNVVFPAVIEFNVAEIVTATITNDGTTASVPTIVDLYILQPGLNGPGSIIPVQDGTTVPALGVGESTTIQFPVTITGLNNLNTFTPLPTLGNYVIVTEETANSPFSYLSCNGTLDFEVDFVDVDLELSWVDNDGCYDENYRIPAGLKITNVGNSTPTSSTYVALGTLAFIDFPADDIVYTSLVGSAYWRVPNILAPGESAILEGVFKVPNNSNNGDYEINARIETEGSAIEDINPSNNTANQLFAFDENCGVNTCQIEAIVTNIQCDNAGSPNNPVDDIFTFDLTILNAGSNGSSPVILNTNCPFNYGLYGETVSNGPFLISGFPETISCVVRDSEDAACSTSITVAVPNSCSDGGNCTFDFDYAEAYCDDNNTPNNPNDDQWFISVHPTGTGLGTSYSIFRQGTEVASNLPYGQEYILGPFPPADDNIPIPLYQISLTITDDDFACTNTSILDIRGTCSQSSGDEVDLELNLTTTSPNPSIFTTVPLTYVVTNNSATVATNVEVYLSICSPDENRPRLFFNEYGIVNASTPVNPSVGTYSITNQTWSIPELAAGSSESITIYVFTLTDEPRTILGEVFRTDQMDIDSSPSNLLTCMTNEDDEASLTINGDSQEPLPDLYVTNAFIFGGITDLAAGEAYELRYTAYNEFDEIAPPHLYDIFLSIDENLSGNDILLEQQNSGVIQPNSSASRSKSITIPADQTAGNYFILIKTDSQEVVEESDETNNLYALAITILNGVCTCEAVVEPVCGSDGITYGNACLAECAGIFDYTLGECPIENDGIDLELEIIAPASYNIYTNVNFQARVVNNGTVNAENVKIDFPLPEGFVHSSNMASHGAYDLFRETWNVGTLKVGETAVLDLNLFALTSGAITAYAQVTNASPADVDSTPDNGTCCIPNEDDEAAVTISSSFQNGNGSTALRTPVVNRDLEIKSLYPNIATNEVTIFVQSKLPELKLRVYSLQGHEVLQQKYQDAEGFQRLSLDVSTLPTGTYLIRFDGTLGQQMIKFVKTRM